MTLLQAHTEAMKRLGMNDDDIKSCQQWASMQISIPEILKLEIIKGMEEGLISEMMKDIAPEMILSALDVAKESNYKN